MDPVQALRNCGTHAELAMWELLLAIEAADDLPKVHHSDREGDAIWKTRSALTETYVRLARIQAAVGRNLPPQV